MPKGPRRAEKRSHEITTADDSRGRSAPSTNAVVAALCGLAAAWIAAGSTGLMAHPLRHALTWLAAGTAMLALWPTGKQTLSKVAGLLLAATAAAVMTAVESSVVNLLAVTLVLAALARASRGIDGRVLTIAAAATAVLGVFRLAVTSIPIVWSMADTAGRGLGRLAELILAKPLCVGASFGGIDFLVLMAAVIVGWLACTSPPRASRAVCAVIGVLGVHLVYLTVLAYWSELAAALPEAPLGPETDLYEPTAWSWSEAIGSLMPWNLPALAGAIQLAVCALLFRWAEWLTPKEQTEDAVAAAGVPKALIAVPVILAVAIPLVTVLCDGSSNLAGKHVVAFDQGFVDWDSPAMDRYGQQSAGTCGMLDDFIVSLGGNFSRSADLSAADLATADVLILVHPVTPWPDDRLDRVWEFVRCGGSLLVLAEPRVHENGLSSAFDEVLRPTSMQVRFDTAIAGSARWEHASQLLAHPATTVIDDGRNRLGLVTSSSIDARWPARPLVVGRWGWSDPGSDAVLTDVFRFEPGEKLGDLVLAAEEPLGSGTVVVLGDTAAFTNEGTAESYPFSGRLLGYLARTSGSPQVAWRQGAGLVACLVLVGLLLWRTTPGRLVAVALAMSISSVVAVQTGRESLRVLPKAPIVCIDGSHVEAYNDFNWSYDGIAGLKLTLMRNGYLPLVLPELTAERLAGAEMLFSIAPGRAFSEAERKAVAEFVSAGGTLVVTAGAERAGPVNSLLDEFGFGVPTSPVTSGEKRGDPAPLGHLRCWYPHGGQWQAGLLLYAGWPIEFPVFGLTNVIARGPGPDNLPVIATGTFGDGVVLVVGDTGFVMNKNLEYMSGQPFDGGYENAHFWRWLIAEMTDRAEWIPPPREKEVEESEGDKDSTDGPPKETPNGGIEEIMPLDPGKPTKGDEKKVEVLKEPERLMPLEAGNPLLEPIALPQRISESEVAK